MKLFARTTKIAGSLAAALMISAPLALAATPTFAADYHDGDRDNYNRDNDRHDGDRSNYRGGDDRSYGDRDYRDHDYRDNGYSGMWQQRMAFRHSGHWGYSHGRHMWFAAFFGR